MPKTVRIRVSRSIANQLRDLADAQNTTIDAVLRAALDALQRKMERERLAAEPEPADRPE
jgi:predicted transcriptional regulator